MVIWDAMNWDINRVFGMIRNISDSLRSQSIIEIIPWKRYSCNSQHVSVQYSANTFFYSILKNFACEIYLIFFFKNSFCNS